jgi:hypothetical protein
VTPMRPIGVRQKGEGSHIEFFLLPIGHLGFIYDPQPARIYNNSRRLRTFFIAICIRVNICLYPILCQAKLFRDELVRAFWM